MATRTDVKIYQYLTPRLLIVDAPSTSLNIQDLHDTLSEIDDDFTSMSYPKLLATAGKEDLGGGNFVGLTLTLQNCQVGFEHRTQILQSGTVTTASGTPLEVISLHDSAATFITNGVTRGDVVVNTSDSTGSHAEVVTVVSETELEVLAPGGGGENDFDVGESYLVWLVEECTIDGGNLVAVDTSDAAITPLFPTFGTYITRVLSSSATIAASDPADIMTALRAEIYDGESFETILTRLKAWGYGKFVETGTNVFDYYAFDDATVLFTLTLTEAGPLVSRARS